MARSLRVTPLSTKPGEKLEIDEIYRLYPMREVFLTRCRMTSERSKQSPRNFDVSEADSNDAIDFGPLLPSGNPRGGGPFDREKHRMFWSEVGEPLGAVSPRRRGRHFLTRDHLRPLRRKGVPSPNGRGAPPTHLEPRAESGREEFLRREGRLQGQSLE